MSETQDKMCIYPGCDRPAVAGHELGGPQPHFCDDEGHNAGSAHNARKALEAEGAATGGGGDEASA